MKVEVSREVEKIIKDLREKYKTEEKIESIKNAGISGVILKLSPRIFANVRRVPELWKVLGCNYEYVIAVNERYWKSLSEVQKESIIYHELNHCVGIDRDGEFKYKLKDHDIEEFSSVIKKYGDFLPSIKDFMKKASLKKDDENKKETK